MGRGQNRAVAPHAVRARGDLVAAPGLAELIQIVANQQGTAAFAEVIDLAGVEFPVAQAAFQMRQ